MRELRLEVVQFDAPSRWRWELSDPGDGAVTAHDVNLDTAAWQYGAAQDVYTYLRLHAAPDRRLTDEAKIVAEIGRWIGEEIFSSVGPVLARYAPVAVRVVAPWQARIVASYPLEMAIVNGAQLALQRVGLVFDVDEPSAPAHVKRPADARLRVLGLFSLPDGTSAMNLRKERHGLARLFETIATNDRRAVEFRPVQYGVTRERLRQIVDDPDGWDIVHLSAHGRAGALVLERPDGRPDLIETGELMELLAPLAERVKMVTISACSSAALVAVEQFELLGIAAQPSASEDATSSAVQAENDGDRAGPVTALAMEMASRLQCAVLAMRFPVTEEFAAGLAADLYGSMIAKGRSLPDALASVLPTLIAEPPSAWCPALSAGTPAIFGSYALNTQIWSSQAQDQAPIEEREREPADYPPQPERFVGQVRVMARVHAAMAPDSGVAAVMLCGMAGAGKSTCASELVHTQRDEFDAVVWFQAPDEDADISDALARFASVLEKKFPRLAFVHLVDDAAALRGFLPTLTRFASENRVLIVIDNAESLLTATGTWRHESWRIVVEALAAHQGAARLLITSRRPIAGDVERVRVEAVHALSRDEALLLARELPHLKALMDGRLEGVNPTVARQLAGRVLSVTQGHPKLMELADGQATDPARLLKLLAAADETWIARGGLPEGFFTTADAPASADDYTSILTSWTQSLAAGLPDEAKFLLWFLCALEEDDRAAAHTMAIISTPGANIPPNERGSRNPVEAEQISSLLGEWALVQPDRDPDTGRLLGYRIHPLVVAAVREQAGPEFQAGVDARLADHWSRIAGHARARTGGEATAITALAARRILPYLFRLGAWEHVRGYLDTAVSRDSSRSSVGALLPLARRLVRATAGTDENLWARRSMVRLTRWLDEEAGLVLARQLVADALASDRYDVAFMAGNDVAYACRRTGRFAEALTVARDHAELARQAGYGPWTQISAEALELQILISQGEYEHVLTQVDRLLPRAQSLPMVRERTEAVEPWNIWESLLDTGNDAANQLGRWEQALAYSERAVESQQRRGAPDQILARTWFNTYRPLLELDRAQEAINMLMACREIYETDGDLPRLGRVLSALAEAEDRRGHGSVAVDTERNALRLKYLTGDPEGVMISHANLGAYLANHDIDSATARCHILAAEVIKVLIRGGWRDADAEALARRLPVDPDAEAPTTIAALSDAINEAEGVRLDNVLDRLADAAAQQSTLDKILNDARAHAAKRLARAFPMGEMFVGMERNNLRLRYRAGDPDGAAVSHHRLGAYLAVYVSDPIAATPHLLAAALIGTLIGGNHRGTSLSAVAHHLTVTPDPDAVPTTIAALCDAVNDAEGIRLDSILNRLADADTQQRTLNRILNHARTSPTEPLV